MSTAQYELWHQAVLWLGVGMLPRLRQMTAAQRLTVMREAEEHSNREPLWYWAAERKFTVPSWDPAPLTGAQVVALMVYGLWVQMGEDAEMCSGLVESWPGLTDFASVFRADPVE